MIQMVPALLQETLTVNISWRGSTSPGRDLNYLGKSLYNFGGLNTQICKR
jgi:hypothetical protein